MNSLWGCLPSPHLQGGINASIRDEQLSRMHTAADRNKEKDIMHQFPSIAFKDPLYFKVCFKFNPGQSSAINHIALAGE